MVNIMPIVWSDDDDDTEEMSQSDHHYVGTYHSNSWLESVYVLGTAKPTDKYVTASQQENELYSKRKPGTDITSELSEEVAHKRLRSCTGTKVDRTEDASIGPEDLHTKRKFSVQAGSQPVVTDSNFTSKRSKPTVGVGEENATVDTKEGVMHRGDIPAWVISTVERKVQPDTNGLKPPAGSILSTPLPPPPNSVRPKPVTEDDTVVRAPGWWKCNECRFANGNIAFYCCVCGCEEVAEALGISAHKDTAACDFRIDQKLLAKREHREVYSATKKEPMK
jgi:hypothetical protein